MCLSKKGPKGSAHSARGCYCACCDRERNRQRLNKPKPHSIVGCRCGVCEQKRSWRVAYRARRRDHILATQRAYWEKSRTQEFLAKKRVRENLRGALRREKLRAERAATADVLGQNTMNALRALKEML